MKTNRKSANGQHSIPKGILRNNYLNIRATRDHWQGQRGQSGGFVDFVAPAWGYRAAFVLLHNYWLGGRRTLRQIIERWAPPSDGNHTEAYIATVEGLTGIGRNDVLAPPYCNPRYRDLVSAMSRVEVGAVDSLALEQGFKLYLTYVTE